MAGTSGGGKSTLLWLRGFETPPAGSVLPDGQGLAEPDVRAPARGAHPGPVGERLSAPPTGRS
ncbi:hypothetical protein OG778_26770 [Streptomyces sp. NBC_00184]|uniref:hypothetical protein n=1 Tax=Streptomyces sp. NBC_00184 TaxID=2975673 RepID=UPI002E2C81E4|nr:hypothetical protein [Streptomyces sp. NBC_00184]